MAVHRDGLGEVEKVTQYFSSLGIAAARLNAPFVALLEFAGGILLIMGSRLVAALLAIDMVVAYIAADREALVSVFSDPDKFYAAAPYTFLIASMLVFTFGPGKFSLDAFIESRRKKTGRPPLSGESVRRHGAQ